MRKKSSRGIVRKDRADHEQSRAPADDRERNPIDLAVKCNADHAHTAAANVDQTRRTSCDLICVGEATLPDVQTRIGKTIMGRREGMFDNLHDGSVTCIGAGGVTAFRQQFQNKFIGGRCEDAIASTSSPSDIAFP
jgi:hypothetical protein